MSRRWFTAGALTGIAAPFTGPGIMLAGFALFTVGAVVWFAEGVRNAIR